MSELLPVLERIAAALERAYPVVKESGWRPKGLVDTACCCGHDFHAERMCGECGCSVYWPATRKPLPAPRMTKV